MQKILEDRYTSTEIKLNSNSISKEHESHIVSPRDINFVGAKRHVTQQSMQSAIKASTEGIASSQDVTPVMNAYDTNYPKTFKQKTIAFPQSAQLILVDNNPAHNLVPMSKMSLN